MSSLRALRVLFFASTREAAGRREFVLTVGETATLEEALQEVLRRFPTLGPRSSYRLALDGEFVTERWDRVKLGEAKELAILPPFSGG